MDEKELNENGCEFGRFNRKDILDMKKDFNCMGKKMDKVYNFMLMNLGSLVLALLLLVLNLLIKRI